MSLKAFKVPLLAENIYRPFIGQNPIESLFEVLYKHKTVCGSFYGEKTLHRSSLKNKSLCMGDFFQVHHRQKIINRSSTDLKPLTGLLQSLNLLQFFYRQKIYYRFSVDKITFSSLFYRQKAL